MTEKMTPNALLYDMVVWSLSPCWMGTGERGRNSVGGLFITQAYGRTSNPDPLGTTGILKSSVLITRVASLTFGTVKSPTIF